MPDVVKDASLRAGSAAHTFWLCQAKFRTAQQMLREAHSQALEWHTGDDPDANVRFADGVACVPSQHNRTRNYCS